jgi:flagellar basal body rod protein FlgC
MAESFLKFFEKYGVEHRHMKDVIPDPISHPQTPGKTVPDYVRTKVKNQKVQTLMNQDSGKQILNIQDIQQIQNEYNLEFDPQNPKKLGNTGIVLKFDPIFRKAIIEK